MKRSDVTELHYITPISNVPSILKEGILCHRVADRVKHESVAMKEIQAIRAKKTVPGGKPLHYYVNLYFTARNPMLYLRRSQHRNLCVLQINTDVLDLPNVVITDRNASRPTAFFPSPSGLSKLDRDLVYAQSWTDADPIIQWHKKGAKCAEVLVLERLHPRFINGAFVSCNESKLALSAIAPQLSVIVNPHLFFQ